MRTKIFGEFEHWFPWVPWLLVVFALVLMLIQILDLTTFLHQSTIRMTTGKILSTGEIPGGYEGSGGGCFMTYQFFLPNGRQIRGEAGVWCPFYYQAGDAAPIAFSLHDPTNVRIIPPGGVPWGCVRFFLPLFLGCIIFSSLWTWFFKKALK